MHSWPRSDRLVVRTERASAATAAADGFPLNRPKISSTDVPAGTPGPDRLPRGSRAPAAHRTTAPGSE